MCQWGKAQMRYRNITKTPASAQLGGTSLRRSTKTRPTRTANSNITIQRATRFEGSTKPNTQARK